MVELSFLIATVLIAAASILWTLKRSLKTDKRSCSCEHGCSRGNQCTCEGADCAGHAVLTESGCFKRAFDEKKSLIKPLGPERNDNS
jgi:hypothetical protein